MINPDIQRRKLSLIRKVDGSQPNLHYGEMKEACRLKPKALALKFGLTELTTDDGKKMWFKDNGSKVLFVAHLDTVQNYYELDTAKLKEDTFIFCPTLDDRLGVYIGLYWLPKAGIKPDILLTTDEEKMKSTGHWFQPPKQYNWMFMFDRRDDGAVVYQYSDEKLKYKLGKHGFSVSTGSYSCIKDMSHLKCSGINFGCGYADNHSTYAYASKRILESQLRKFRDFWKEYSTTAMPWEDPYAYYKSKVYRNYVSDVNKHVESFKEKIGKVKISPSEDTYGSYGEMKKAEAAALVKIKEATSGIIEDPHIQEISEALKAPDYHDVKTLVTVGDGGRIKGYISTRVMYKLYWETKILPIDPVLLTILRTQWKVFTLYDLCKLSAYKIVNSGYITAKDADAIRKAMVDAGFDMPMNVQGLMTPEQYELQQAVGYKARERTVKAKPIPVEKRMMDVADKLHDLNKRVINLKDQMVIMDAKLRRKDNKTIDLYPMPDVDLTYVIKKSRALIRDGYPVEMHSMCPECQKIFTWDVIKHDAAPVKCEVCQSQLSLFPASNADEGSDILTKIILEKDVNDKTEFKYLGKDKGVGIERFGWVDRPLEKRAIGFSV